MSNSPSGSDDTIGQLLVEAELGQYIPQYNLTQLIVYGNLVVGQGQSPYLTPPTELN